MPLARPTPAAVSAYALSLAGRSRDHLPVPWTASPSMDDCAAFCSHVLWGGLPGPILWVDNFKSAGDGGYGGGATDLQPWDVLLFDWDGNGVGNHVEFMVADLGNGYVRTFGANGSDSREARYRTRPKHYIMGRFRPAWVTLSNHITSPDTEDDDMASEDIKQIREDLSWLKGNVQAIKNSLNDPERGVLKTSSDAAANSSQTLSRVKTILKHLGLK